MTKKDYINIKWQDGTVKDNGENGVQVEDVLNEVKTHLEKLNNEVRSWENDLSLKYLEQAIHWQYQRTQNRKDNGVEGTKEVVAGDTKVEE